MEGYRLFFGVSCMGTNMEMRLAAAVDGHKHIHSSVKSGQQSGDALQLGLLSSYLDSGVDILTYCFPASMNNTASLNPEHSMMYSE